MQRVLFGVFVMTIISIPATAQPAPPIAREIPFRIEKHGHVRTDPYYWLNDRDNPDVIAYLEAENAYTEAMTAHTGKLQKTLFEEFRARMKEDDASPPYRKKDYWYYTRYETGKEYPVYARRKSTLEAPEEVMLDVNQAAGGFDYYNVGALSVSTDQRLMAVASDTMGRRVYTIRFKDLATGEILPDVISETTPNIAWANDDKTLFYSRQDPQTLRSFRIYRHELGTDPAGDVLVYEEPDETFSAFVRKTRSEKYLLIGSVSTLSTEYRYAEADRPAGEFRVILPREPDHEYHPDHFGDDFLLRTNWQAKNFRLMRTPVGSTDKSGWSTVIPHREDVLLEDFDVFRNHLVLTERKDGLIRLRVRSWTGEGEHYIDFGEPAYLAYVGTNPEFDTNLLRFGYTSMTTPNSTYEYDMATRERTLIKRDPVLGDFDPDDYVTERLYAPAPDGTPVPISLVYRKGTRKEGPAPLVLYGYGSYGFSIDPRFSITRLSLLDRGFVYAIAHIRGGEEMGRPWYESGKLLSKKNTFTDFIAAGEYLVADGYADPQRLFAMGGSAGGLLMGAVINMRPDLFKGVIAAVPFVDVVTTMLDDTIPLTTSEYDEWGNPNDKTYYDYLLSYSPYDNVEKKAYPNLLVTTGLHDSQVQYWEPAKWVAKLRTHKTDTNRLLLKTNMDAGHGGASGRFEALKETAFEYAFLLDLAGADKVKPAAD